MTADDTAVQEHPNPVAGVFDDVAAILRRVLVVRGKSTCVMSVISPFSDEPFPEEVVVNAAEKMQVDSGKRHVVVVFSRVDRRKNLLYHYTPDGTLLHVGAPRKTFRMHTTTREEALRKLGR